mmetsp:Transcript_10229/g.21472  ORF Transcript_10229/g.21472 Transcript_10229/m.21472 type:complete len:90 (-) Transcript_10229:465-734(-)
MNVQYNGSISNVKTPAVNTTTRATIDNCQEVFGLVKLVTRKAISVPGKLPTMVTKKKMETSVGVSLRVSFKYITDTVIIAAAAVETTQN